MDKDPVVGEAPVTVAVSPLVVYVHVIPFTF